ncbi:hypothetical protein J4457_03965, partial [Candidatus Woesearchaeota archaeon]|nr:hypothetical protein [Candidatus Woesearchaeota archaeon]
MDRSPYINAIVAIVVIVAIVLFVDLYLQMPQERTAGEAMQQLNMITGAVVANSQCSTCVCIQQMPYTNGPLSFAASPSTCSNS